MLLHLICPIRYGLKNDVTKEEDGIQKMPRGQDISI